MSNQPNISQPPCSTSTTPCWRSLSSGNRDRVGHLWKQSGTSLGTQTEWDILSHYRLFDPPRHHSNRCGSAAAQCVPARLPSLAPQPVPSIVPSHQQHTTTRDNFCFHCAALIEYKMCVSSVFLLWQPHTARRTHSQWPHHNPPRPHSDRWWV